MIESHLEFYQKHNVSPVRQDISDLQAHFQRRRSLYFHLGIMSNCIRGRKILEVGPGSGHNSLFTASLDPASYTLVEPNPTGVEHIEKLYSGFPEFEKKLLIKNVSIESYESPNLFDFVFCEGMLPGHPNPVPTLNKLAKLVAPGGALIITCADTLSLFPEMLRRLIGGLLVTPDSTMQEKVSLLMPVFSPHLDTIKGVSRRHDDWIIDTIINPAISGELLSIPDAISVVKDDFDCFGSSPNFITDWRWYKSIVGDNTNFNQAAIDQYWENAHNFIDYRDLFSPRSKVENQRLVEICHNTSGKIGKFEKTQEIGLIQEILEDLKTIEEMIGKFSRNTAMAIQEFKGIISGSALNKTALKECVNFASFFGRGQQYLSFLKRG
jgi:SAM-dependent methyltransferase